MSKYLPCPYCEEKISVNEKQCPFCYADFTKGELEYALKNNISERYKLKLNIEDTEESIEKTYIKKLKTPKNKRSNEQNSNFFLEYILKAILIFVFNIFYLAGLGRFFTGLISMVFPFFIIAFMEEIWKIKLNLNEDELLEYFMYYWAFASLLLPFRLKNTKFKIWKFILYITLLFVFFQAF